MRNFVRALRHAWPYRGRMVVSVFCAVFAAALWGLNLTSIYPVLKLLHSDCSPQQWIDDRIGQVQQEIDSLARRIDEKEEESKQWEKHPNRKLREKSIRDLASDLARLEGKLGLARDALARYQLARKYVYMLPSSPFRTLALVIGLVVAGVAVKCVFEIGQESLVGSVVNRSIYDLRNRFYRNVIHLDVDQFSDKGTSELMARFTNDMEALGTGLKTLFGKVVGEPLRALACIILASLISWQLTLMFLVLVPVAGFVLGKVGRIMKKATRRLLERMSSIYKILQESFQGIRVVKAYTMEPYERQRFNVATKDYCKRQQTVINIDALAGPIIEVLGVITVAGALLAGSYLVLQKQTHLLGMRMTTQPLEAETLLQLYLLLVAVADPVRKLSSVFTRIQAGAAAADRIFAFLDRQPRVRTNSLGFRLQRRVLEETVPATPATPMAADVHPVNSAAKPFIEFRNVCFSYDPGGKDILDHVSFQVGHGETIALVGPNGCGKSTLVGLLPRFADPTHGSVLVAGHDLRSVHVRRLPPANRPGDAGNDPLRRHHLQEHRLWNARRHP